MLDKNREEIPRIYYAPGTCALGAMAAFGMANIQYEPVMVDMASPRTELRSISPVGKVPVLQIGDQILTESLALICWADLQRPEAGLLPQDSVERIHALSLMSWLSSTVHILRRQYFKPEAFCPETATHEFLKQAAIPPYREAIRSLDAIFSRAPSYMCPGIEAYALAFFSWAIRDGLPVKEFHGLHNSAARLVHNPNVERALSLHKSPVFEFVSQDSNQH